MVEPSCTKGGPTGATVMDGCPLTVTTFESEAEPPEPEQVTVKVVLPNVSSVTLVVPVTAPPVLKPVPVHDVALVENHESDVVFPTP